MRSLLAAALGGTLVLSLAVPALAHPNVELAPTMPADLSHARTDNVLYHGRFPEHAGTAGGSLVGDVFFVTDPRGVFAYDVSAPEAPELLGSLTLYQNGTGAALAQEDPDTDGEILVVDGSPTLGTSNRLQVVDVSDPKAMTIIGSADVKDHTWTCVSATDEGRCDYAYGRSGYIVDLTDPTAPVELPTGWREPADHGSNGNNTPYTHDLTQISPGLTMSAGETNVLLDTSNPAAPELITKIEQPGRFSQYGYHSVEWANGGHDPIAVFGTEVAPQGPTNLAGSNCDGDESVIETWDASGFARMMTAYEQSGNAAVFDQAEAFERIDAFRVSGRGLFLEGDAPAHVLYCAHWMELHPDFDAGGKMVVSYYDRGTRFVEISDRGVMDEIGWIVPAEGYSGSSQWVGTSATGGDVVYIMDYRRGMEVVELVGEEATEVVRSGADLLAAGSTIEPVTLGADRGVPMSSAVAAGFGLALAGVEVLRRRRLRTTA